MRSHQIRRNWAGSGGCCETCDTRGSALKEFDFYVPHDFDEAKAFLAGEPLEIRKIKT